MHKWNENIKKGEKIAQNEAISKYITIIIIKSNEKISIYKIWCSSNCFSFDSKPKTALYFAWEMFFKNKNKKKLYFMERILFNIIKN